MADQHPISNWTLTPARITLLVLGVIAVLMILGTIFGGLNNYETLHEASTPTDPASTTAGAAPAK